MDYEFTKDHHFFQEVVVYTMAVIGFNSLYNLQRVREQLASFTNLVNEERRLPNNFTVTLDMAAEAEGVGHVANSVLLNAQEISTAVQNSKAIPIIKYSDAPATGTLVTDDTYRRIEVPPAVMIYSSQLSVGSAFERVKEEIESKYGPGPQNWPPLLQYFRHLRNACFHGNEFLIRTRRGQPGIDPHNPPVWRDSTMADDATMNTKVLFEEFWGVGDVPIFLGDVDEFLRAKSVFP